MRILPLFFCSKNNPAASAAEVPSANVVGYATLDLPANTLTLCGNNFQYIGDTSIDIQDVMSVGLNEEGVDYLKVWDPITRKYMTAYYWGDSTGGVYDDVNNTPDNWDDDVELGAGWGDNNQTALHAELTPGTGFWMFSNEGGKIKIAGELTTSNSIELPANQLVLVCNTLPMAIELQEIKGKDLNEEGVDYLKVWDPTTRKYMMAYYWGDSTGGVYDDVNNTPDNWDDDVELGAGWGDNNQTALHADIKLGEGFWMFSNEGGTAVFPKAK